MTANDPWDKKFSTLRKASEMVELNTLAYTSIVKVLQKICESENIEYDIDILKSFARQAGGDLRGSINDLQTICASKKTLEKKDLEMLSERRQTENMPQSLMKIFKTKDLNIAINAFDDSNVDIDKRFIWIENNIPKEYESAGDIYRAFESLSRADVFRGRISRWQYWRFLVYVNFFQTCGIAIAKEEKYKKFIPYSQGDRILKLWMGKNSSAKKRSIANKISCKTPQSEKSIFKQNIAFYKLMCKSNKEFQKQFSQDFELGKEEIAWLLK